MPHDINRRAAYEQPGPAGSSQGDPLVAKKLGDQLMGEVKRRQQAEERIQKLEADLEDAKTAVKELAVRPLQSLTEAAHHNAVEHGFWDTVPEFGTSIALVHTEVTEAFEEWRSGHDFTEVYYGEGYKPEGVPIELADVLIRVFDIAGRYGIDLDNAVSMKMAYNASRPYLHGGKRA